jgi:hypothetical protein
VLQRGIDTGEIRGNVDPELPGDLIVRPMVSRAMLRPDSALAEGLSERMVDTVLEGSCPRG